MKTLDIKAEIEKTVKKITGDPKLIEEFKKNPAAAIKKVFPSIPADMIDAVIDTVKTKLTADNIGNIAGKIGEIFKK